MKKAFLITCIFISILIAGILFSIEWERTFAGLIVNILLATFPLGLYIRKYLASKYYFERKKKNTIIYLCIFLLPFCYFTINTEKLLGSLAETGYMIVFFVLITLYNFLTNNYKKFKYPYFVLVYLLCYPLYYLLHVCYPTTFFSGESFFFMLFLQSIFHIVLYSFFCMLDILLFSFQIVKNFKIL